MIPLTDDDLTTLASNLVATQNEQGFVGMDLRMAALSILDTRGINAGFKMKDHSKTNLEYWAAKRHFGFVTCDTDDDVIYLASEQYL